MVVTLFNFSSSPLRRSPGSTLLCLIEPGLDLNQTRFVIFSEGALIPTHQSGKALYYNSIKTELKSPQKADQKKGQQQQQKQQQQNQQQQQQQNQQQQGKATKVVFSNGGVNTALHDGGEHATAPNGKLLEKASNENGKVVENGNHGKFKPENSDNVSDDSRREKGTVQSCGELPGGSLANGHFAKSSDVNGKADDDVNVVLNGHSNGGSSNFSSNCSSPTNGLSSLPTPRRSLPSTRYSASVARERELESECQSETSSVLTTSTPVNCSPHVQRRTEEEEAVRAV